MEPIKDVPKEKLDALVKDLKDEGCEVVIEKQHNGLYTIIPTPKESSAFGKE